ncbi:MAG TPA: hypothetical protein ENN84_10250 [Candidatus Marinimicrobia bacterium]|nr:hypothetical protein [Candidatus Neomarinimicrobiota bacterium]
MKIVVTIAVTLVLLGFSCSTQSSCPSNFKQILKPGCIDDKSILSQNPEAKMIDDLREGLWLWNYPDGTRYLEAEYSHGQPHGYWKYYSENGKLQRQEYYYQGKAAGLWQYYTSTGALQMEILHYQQNSTREHIYYFPGGDIAYRQKFVKTDIYRLDGYSAEYYKHGQLRFETYFENGEIAGYQRWYYPNGQLMMEGFQKNGQHLGVWTKYDVNGIVQEQTIAPDPHWVYQHIPLE